MKRFLGTLGRNPGPLVGSFVALFISGVLITAVASLIGTSPTLRAPVRRLARAAVVITGDQTVRVTSGSGQSAGTDSVPLPAYRPLPDGLAGRLRSLPGVAAAVPDISFPVALQLPGGKLTTGTGPAPITGHGWPSAALTPFVLRSGRPPVGPRQVVVGTGLARSARLHPGNRVRLAGSPLAPFTVTGVADAPGHPVLGRSTVFFSVAEAAALFSHPGRADLIGLVADRGATPAALARRVRASVRGERLDVLSGASRDQAEDLALSGDRAGLLALGTSGGLDLALIGLFVVAGTVALSVAERRHYFALLRSVGASPGQVRREVRRELAALGALAGALSYLPGTWLASLTVRSLAAHQLLPSGARAWTSWWIVPIATGAGVLVAELSGLVAARRASRTPPAVALGEAVVERRRPHPVRVVLGLGALAGGVALLAAALGGGTAQLLSQALVSLLLLLAAVALLGPVFVMAAEGLARGAVRALSPVSGRLSMAQARWNPRRMASAVIPAALSVALVGGIFLIGSMTNRASVVQGRERLAASEVVSAPGPGLAPQALTAVAAVPGVRAAVGLIPTSVVAPDQSGQAVAGEAVTPGPLRSLLHLGVVSGTLRRFGPGDIAVSTEEAGSAGLSTHVGDVITTYLADGTPYRAKVTAIFSRFVGFGDVVIPTGAGGGGHLGSTSISQILVRGAGATRLAARLSGLAVRFPGLVVRSRSVVNAEAAQQDAQNAYVNDLVLVPVALLAAVALANTLVMSAVEQRGTLQLLRRIGATPRQLLSAAVWQTALLGTLGVLLGAGTAAGTLVAFSRMLTGAWTPSLPWAPALAIVALVFALSAAGTLLPTAALLSRPRLRGQG